MIIRVIRTMHKLNKVTHGTAEGDDVILDWVDVKPPEPGATIQFHDFRPGGVVLVWNKEMPS